MQNEDIATKILNLVINIFAILSGLFFPMYIFWEKLLIYLLYLQLQK